MKKTQCLFNSRAALHRVFVSPLGSSAVCSAAGLSQHRLFSSRLLRGSTWKPTVALTAGCLRPTFRRSFKSAAVLYYPPGNPRGRVQPDRLPIDHEIRDRRIMVADKDGQVTGPHFTKNVLQSLDPVTQSLRMVARPRPSPAEPVKNASSQAGRPPARPPAVEKGSSGYDFAVCKIVNKNEERQREEQLRKEARARERLAAKHKELEINWAIAEHDLEIKLRKLREFLAKGYRVDVLLAKKKRAAKLATREEMEAVVETVKGVVAETEGAKERRPVEGFLGKSMRLYLEGKAP